MSRKLFLTGMLAVLANRLAVLNRFYLLVE